MIPDSSWDVDVGEATEARRDAIVTKAAELMRPLHADDDNEPAQKNLQNCAELYLAGKLLHWIGNSLFSQGVASYASRARTMTRTSPCTSATICL